MRIRNPFAFLIGRNIYYRADETREVASGSINGRAWSIISHRGVFPAAYVASPKDRRAVRSARCPAPGGLTYFGPLPTLPPISAHSEHPGIRMSFAPATYVGWDHAGPGDFLNSAKLPPTHAPSPGKRHSVRSIKKEVRAVCAWLDALDGKEGPRR